MTAQLPPDGALLLLTSEAGAWLRRPVRFRAVIVHADRPGTALLRGWFLGDGRDISEQRIRVALAGVTVLEST